MEAILDSLAAEKRRYHADFRQIAEAVVLALCCVLLCRYVCVKADDAPMKKAAPAAESISGSFAGSGLPVIPELIGRNRAEIFPKLTGTDGAGIFPELIGRENSEIFPDTGNDFSDSGVPANLTSGKGAVPTAAAGKPADGRKTVGKAGIEKVSAEAAESAAPQIQTLPEDVPDVKDTPATAEPEEKKKEVPLLLSVELYGNGGMPELVTDTCEEGAFELSVYEEPKRLGKLFDGWYTDADCTRAFSGVEDGETSLRLYAGWKEFPGFVSNDRGYITGYTEPSKFIGDGMAVFPYYETCTGIEKNALNGLEGEIFELYIPANITYIEEGAFDGLDHLLYVQVEPGNPAFYSRHGTLYRADGSEFINREH